MSFVQVLSVMTLIGGVRGGVELYLVSLVTVVTHVSKLNHFHMVYFSDKCGLLIACEMSLDKWLIKAKGRCMLQ